MLHCNLFVDGRKYSISVDINPIFKFSLIFEFIIILFTLILSETIG